MYEEEELHTTNIPVNGPGLKMKAKPLACKLSILGFIAWNDWIDCFKHRHSLSYKSICDESVVIS